MRSSVANLRSILIRLLFGAYRMIVSPALHWIAGPGMGCRFEPTCGEYAKTALSQYGFFRGGFLALHRLCRCHPFSKAGYDPVP